MSDFGTLKETLLGAMSRTSNSFQAGQVNFVDRAINNALIHCQRQQDFEWNKGSFSIDCIKHGDGALYGDIRVAKDIDGCPVKLKRIDRAFGVQQPNFFTDVSIPYISRASQISDDTAGRENHVRLCGPSVIHHGPRIYLSPQRTDQEPYTLWFEAVKWLPPLCQDRETNFLFDYGFDFLMYRSIIELNSWIKEDERFQVSMVLMQTAWKSLIAWDSYLVGPTDGETDLD